MEIDQTDFRKKQSDSKANEQPAQNSSISIQDIPNKQEEGKEKKSLQRRPQFRLNENIKRRF